MELGEDKNSCPLRQADNSPRQGLGTRLPPWATVKLWGPALLSLFLIGRGP